MIHTANPNPTVEKLVEYRTAHYSAQSEAASYFTNTPARVQFRFSNPIICRLTNGFKVMRIGNSAPFGFDIGDAMYVPPNMTIDVDLSAASPDAPIACDCFEIEGTRMQDIVGRLNEGLAARGNSDRLRMDWSNFAVLPSHEADALRLGELMGLFRDPDPIFADARIEAGIDATVLALLQHHSRDLLEMSPGATPDTGENAAARHIRENLDRHIPNSELAQKAAMSKSTLHRQFLRTFGQTPARFAQRLRIARARRLLQRRDISIQQISNDLGFSSVGHFTRVFGKFTGEPPAAYRRRRLGNESSGWEYGARN